MRWFSSRAALVALMFGMCLAATSLVQAGSAGGKIAPPNAKPYGQSPAEWLKAYFRWSNGSAAESEGSAHVFFLTPGPVEDVEGDGTLENPLVLPSHADVTVRAGTALVAVPIAWYGEIFSDHVDPAVPDAWFGTYVTGQVELDGRTVISQVEEYYVPQQAFEPPILYSEPTSYGSLGIAFVQGTVFICKPLPVGEHHLKIKASVRVPADNGLLPETGLVFINSWTITVVP